MASNLLPQNLLTEPLKSLKLKTDVHPDWCPGCGDFGITNAVQQAIAELKLPPWQTYFFSGVGCSGKTPHYINVYGAHTLHGRVLTFASGAKMAHPELHVIAAGGDGDGYGIGVGHFVHAGRRNLDMTYIVFDNEVYGLTKGQASPTLQKGAQPKSLALPNPTQAINPYTLALASGYTFIARSYAFDAKHLRATLAAAIQHRGMALVDVLQPCPTYNNLHDKNFYAEQVQVNGQMVPRTYYLEEDGYNGVVQNPNDPHEVAAKRAAAFERMQRIEERTPLGVFYQIQLPTFHDTMEQNIPALREHSPFDMPIADASGKPITDLSDAMSEFMV